MVLGNEAVGTPKNPQVPGEGDRPGVDNPDEGDKK